MTENELDDWQNLTKSPGWLRLKAFATKMYVDDLHKHLAVAANDTNDLQALNKIRQLSVAKEAIERLMKHPEERIHHLDETKNTAMRRDLAAATRRGGL